MSPDGVSPDGAIPDGAIVDAAIRATRGDLDLMVDLTVAPGEVVAVLGPNGAGKTSLLRLLAGLDGLDSGSISLAGVMVDAPGVATFVPAERRQVGLVFQDALLFPHLSLLENVAFGLRSRGAPRAEARRRAGAWLSRVGIADLASSRPGEVSGGQAQRAALARALAPEPQVLLLDEPLSALDGPVRSSVRRDLRRHLEEFAGATILVTHDPLDALALADRIVILEAGRVTQEGPIAEVTARPRTPYVAALIGVNLLRGTADGTRVALDRRPGAPGVVAIAEPASGPVLVLIPPRAVTVHRQAPEGSARNQWPAEITGFDLLGDRVRVRLDGDVPLVAEVTPDAVAAMRLVEGDKVWATVKATEVTTYPQ